MAGVARQDSIQPDVRCLSLVTILSLSCFWRWSMQVLVWYLWFGHVLLRQNGHAYTVRYKYRVRVPVVRNVREKLLSFALLASNTQHAKVSLSRYCSSVTGSAGCFQPSHASFLMVRFDRWRYALITILPRELGTEVFRGRSDLNIGAGR